MVKPKKDRHVMHPPFVFYFKPRGIPMFALDQIVVSVDEYEAIRLADYEKLKHNEASKKMKISRPTFTRLLNVGHKKISDALVNGKAIKIEGGNFILLKKRFHCKKCNNIWNVEQKNKPPIKCPSCNDNNIVDLNSQCGQRNNRGKKII